MSLANSKVSHKRTYDGISFDLKSGSTVPQNVRNILHEVVSNIIDYYELLGYTEDGICIYGLSLRDKGGFYRLQIDGYVGPSVDYDGNGHSLEHCGVIVDFDPETLQISNIDTEDSEVSVSGDLYPDSDIDVNLIPDEQLGEYLGYCIDELDKYGKPVMGVDFVVFGVNEESYEVDYQKPFDEIHYELDGNPPEHFGASAEAMITARLGLNTLKGWDAVKAGDFKFGKHVVTKEESEKGLGVEGSEYLYVELRGN